MVWVFDVEVFPNFFSAIFKKANSNTTYQFIIFEDKDDTQTLTNFLNSHLVKTLVGFNSENYDIPVLGAVLSGINRHDLYLFSKNIIESDIKPPNYYDYKRRMSFLTSLDIKRILSFDSSLKQLGINLKHDRIEELPLPPDTIIKPSQIEKLLSYNLNDVIITEKAYLKIQGDIDLRIRVKEKYGVDVANASNSAIANLVLEQMYCNLTGIPSSILQDKRTSRKKLPLKNCIGQNIEFSNPKLIQLKEKIENTTLFPPYKKSAFQSSVKINRTKYSVGLGGFHSVDSPGIFKTENNIKIIDADVTSYYPNIAIFNKFVPEHLDERFLEGFAKLLQDRVTEKRKGNLLDAQSLKITILSTIGKYRYKNFWLYDSQQFYSVTLSGELYLLMLVDMLEQNQIHVISANTDGLVVKIDIDQETLYYQICEEWQNKTGFNLEFDTYKTYARRDVNSYIAETEKGKIKTKGIFFDNTNGKEPLSVVCNYGYKMPIVSKALRAFFIDKIEVEEFVKSSKNIYDFLISHKSDKKFKVWFIQRGNQEEIQRTLRYYMPTTNGGKIIKVSDKGARISLSADHWVRLANDINPSDNFESYQVDIDYYIKETNKIVHMIQPPVQQLSLF